MELYRDGVPPVTIIGGKTIFVDDLMIGLGGLRNVGKNALKKLGKAAKGKVFRGGKKGS